MNLNRLSYSLLLVLPFIVVSAVFSQELNSGPRITALGNIAPALHDVWSLQSNQAGIAQLERPIAALAYQNNYFNTDISTQSAVFAYPIKNNVFGISFQNYGFSEYNEQKIGFAYAKRFGKGLSIALNFNAHQVKISQYGNAFAYSVEAGFQFKVNDRLTLGSHVANPNKSGYRKDVDAAVPTLLEVGAAYYLSDKVLFNSGLIKDLDLQTDARFGMEYHVVEWFTLRGGINANPFRQMLGFGCKYHRLQVDLAATSHPVLGYSPQMSLGYEF